MLSAEKANGFTQCNRHRVRPLNIPAFGVVVDPTWPNLVKIG
jgi:hypothetical protein